MDYTTQDCAVEEKILEQNIKVTRINVKTEKAASELGKKPGNYITIEFMPDDTIKYADMIENVMSDELKMLMNIKENDSVLVVGIGNRQILCDSLGVKTVDGIHITNHIPEYCKDQFPLEIKRPVSGLIPGVLSQTGIETFRIINSVVKEISPALIIVIDSLAAKDLSRLFRTIQISDTGMMPGNSKNEISKETLGVPVIAIGVPAVIQAATVIKNFIDFFEIPLNTAKYYKKPGIELTKSDCPDSSSTIDKFLMKYGNYGTMFTPKEIDSYIKDMSRILAGAINEALAAF